MTNSEKLKEVIRSIYAARVAGDIDGTMAAFADDVTFEFNGGGTGVPDLTGPIAGKSSMRNAI